MKTALISIFLFVLIYCCGKPVNKTNKNDTKYVLQEIRTNTSETKYVEQGFGYHADTVYNLKSNLPDGNYEVYYDKQLKNRCIEATVINGNISGKVTKWHRNGQKSHEYFLKNNRKDSMEMEWFENGKMKVLKSYKDSIQNKCMYWNDDGSIKSESFFYEGTEILNLRFENNKIITYEIFKPNNPKFGTPVKIIDFWENGNIKLEKSVKREYLTDKETGQIIEIAINNVDQWYDKEGNKINEKKFKELIEKK